MLIEADNKWGVGREKGPYQETQQDAAEGAAGPGGAVEHAMIVLKLLVILQTKHAQGCGDSADAWREDSANDENFGIVPDAV